MRHLRRWEARFEARFTAWYDRQSIETLIIVGLAPLWGTALVLIVVAVVFG